MEQKSESHVLGIIAMTLAVITLLGSWIPILNTFAFILGLAALIFGVIELWINRKNKKNLGIISTVLAILGTGISLITISTYGSFFEKYLYNYETYWESEETISEPNFTWTQKDYDDLVLGDSTTGAGGSNLEDIRARFGEPTSTSDGTVETDSQSFQTKTYYYESNQVGDYRSVTLAFVKQENGDWLLISKAATDLDIQPEEPEKETVT